VLRDAGLSPQTDVKAKKKASTTRILYLLGKILKGQSKEVVNEYENIVWYCKVGPGMHST